MGWIPIDRVLDAARANGGCAIRMANALQVSRQAIYGRLARNNALRLEVNRIRRAALSICEFPTCNVKVTFEEVPTKRSISRKFCDEHRDKVYTNLIRRAKYHERKM